MSIYTEVAPTGKPKSLDFIDFLQAALNLADRGIPVFPYKPSNKSPLTPAGFKDASTDPAVITDWWSRWPAALIGVPTGKRFVVVDADLQHPEARDWLDANRYRLPVTRTHHTRSGGWHWLFQPHPLVRCSTSKLGKFIDARGDGGYIIWWPACGFEVLHANVLEPVPNWIVQALAPPNEPAPRRIALPPTERTVERQLGGLVRAIAQAPQGQRNSIVFWAGNRMAEMAAAGLINRDWAFALGIEAATRCGLSHIEAQRALNSAFRNR
jgi:hypothetical protein